MPKARVERVVNEDSQSKTIEREVGERGVTKVAKYVIPANENAFRSLVASLPTAPDGGAFVKSIFGEEATDTEESPLAFAYRMYITAVSNRASAMQYESIAQESTEISIGGQKVDVLEFPLADLLVGINGITAQVQTRMLPAKMVVTNMEKQNKGTPEDRAKILEDARVAAEKSIGFGPWKTAGRKLVEGYTDKDGKPVAPKAKLVNGQLVAV